MDFSAAKFWLDLVVVLGLVAQFFWVKRTNRDKATTKNIDDLKKLFIEEQQENEKRLTKLEEHKTNALKHSDLDGIYQEMKGIGKGLAKLEGRFESVDHLNVAIQQIGLEGRK